MITENIFVEVVTIVKLTRKKPVYKKLQSNWPLNPRSQSSKLNFIKNLKKIVYTLEVSNRFVLL